MYKNDHTVKCRCPRSPRIITLRNILNIHVREYKTAFSCERVSVMVNFI